MLGFESADHPLGPWMDAGAGAVRATTAATLQAAAAGPGARSGDAGAGAWRGAFLQAPYLRDTLVAGGIIAETFETAITWDRFDAVRRQTCARGPRPRVAEVCGAAA